MRTLIAGTTEGSREAWKTVDSVARREFYEGDVARALVRDLQAKGSRMAAADLAGYRARIVDAQAVPYRDGRIYVAPGLTG